MFNNCTNMITGNIKFIISLISVLLLVSCATNPPEDYTQQWKADRKIRHIKLDNGVSILYLQAGDEGQTVLLMYTIRTQPGYFEKLIPLLENNYTVYAIDLPGHGYSGLLDTEYTEPLMRTTVQQFIEKLNLT